MSCVFLEDHLSQSVGCARNKHQFLIAPQSLKLFLWMLDYVWMGYLLDIVIEVLRTTKDNIQPSHASSGKLGQIQPIHTSSRKLEYVQPNSTICDSNTKTQHVNRKRGVDQLSEVDRVPTNTRSSQGESQLYIFEDNEAVIKMIIKGRSPTMRPCVENSQSRSWLVVR